MVLFLFLLGLSIGSFLNVLIFRLNVSGAPKFWQGRSICPRCKKEIGWSDNIPLLSFILLSAKCRFCHKKISWRYPIVELITGVFFLMTGFNPVMWVIGSVFIVIFFSDWVYGFIPDEMIVVGSIAGLFLNPSFLVALISAACFFAIVLATKFRGMGLGDVKLVFLIGLLLGWPSALIAFWVAFLLGGFVAVFLVLLKKVKFSDKIAFGPYLIMGTLIAALWSKNLLAIL